MKALLRKLWDAMGGSLWLVPATMLLVAIVVASVTIWLERAEHLSVPEGFRWVFGGGCQGARAILSTIAGSMITVAGVTFSIMMVVLTLASSQFGPRLLRNFMRDKINQTVLGMFGATFVYCLLVLRAIHGPDVTVFVPQISVTIAMLLAILSLGFLTYFVHHVSVTIQPAWVIASVCAECDQVIDALFPEEAEEISEEPGLSPEEREALERFDAEGHPIKAKASGYVQSVDHKMLMSLAQEADVILRQLKRPGDYVIAGAPLLQIWPSAKVSEQVVTRAQRAFLLGKTRVPLDDPEFAINQLVEIAVRALSPGINDPFTAIACIDHLSARLATLARRKFARALRYDDDGALRVVADVYTFAGALDAACNQIRQYAASNVAVLLRMMEAISMVAELARRPSDRDALLHHAGMVHAAGCEAIPEARDRNDLEERYEAVRKILEA
ncbi:MAG: DUF2254 domain-containing protein [Candidatus Hydrogenedentota bacterium]